jgi:hypothetical protein
VEEDYGNIADVGQDDTKACLGMLFAGIVVGGVVGFITARSLGALRRKQMGAR